jgi:hypothetical protein
VASMWRTEKLNFPSAEPGLARGIDKLIVKECLFEEDCWTNVNKIESISAAAHRYCIIEGRYMCSTQPTRI